jgi:hypothetical protein
MSRSLFHLTLGALFCFLSACGQEASPSLPLSLTPPVSIRAIVRSSDPAEYLPRILELPLTNGIIAYIGLSRLSPQEGVYDWTFLDRAVSLCQESGKPLKISINGGRWIPTWIYDKGAAKFQWTLTTNLVDPGSSGAMAPIPWDAVYLHSMEEAAKAVAARYANSPVLQEIQITGPSLANGLEINLPVTPEQAAQMGYTQEKLISAWEHMVDVYAQAFPRQSLSLALNNLIAGERTDVIARSVRDYAIQKYGRQIRVLVCYATDEAWFAPGNNAVEMWIDVPHETMREAQLIDLYSAKNAPPTKVTGAIQRAVDMGATSMEIFAADVLNDTYRVQIEALVNRNTTRK